MGVEAIVEQQERLLAKCDDDVLLFRAEHSEVEDGDFGPIGRSPRKRSFYTVGVLVP